MVRITLCFLLLSITVCGQNREKRRRENLISEIVGSWEFRPGHFVMRNADRKLNAAFDTWHTVLAVFKKDGAYSFTFSDSTKQFGRWSISENGRLLILNDMSDVPAEFESIKELKFPVEIKKDVLSITYPMGIEKPEPTPIDNIVRPVHGYFYVEIKYVRLD